MDKKKVIIIASIIGVIFLAVIVALAIIKLLNTKITVTFDTRGGETIANIWVKKGTEITLPTTNREGYNFLGWYDDSNKRVESKVTIRKSTTFHAQWEEVPKENSFTVTFDSAGGSEVNKLVVECGKELTLPTAPTQEGYTFVTWQDKNETPILDKALLACEDVTLYAKWEKKEEPKKEEPKKETTKKEEPKPVEKPKEYSCPEGYTLDGTQCKMTKDPSYVCPAGTSEDGNNCVTLTDKVAGTRECGEKIINTGGGHTPKVQGVIYNASFASFCYYGEVTDSYESNQANCTSRGHKWNSAWNKCYYDMDSNYTTACPSGYKYYSSSDLLTKFGGHDGGGCFKVSEKNALCDTSNDYVLTGDKCIKTIDATLQ